MGRLLVASNRLPVTLRLEHGEVDARPSSGGLATAMRSVSGEGVVWIGWPGELGKTTPADLAKVDEHLAKIGTKAVHLSAAEVARFYDGFSNGVLWPLLHYLIEKVRLDAHRDWLAYKAVNERFAKTIAETYEPGDRIWIHDYQLTLVPRMLRDLLPGAPIGFFLHVPFPAEQVFRILPWREEILRGLLGADLLGFQTAEDAHHFLSAAVRVLGVEHGADSISHEGRTTFIDAFPIGIDAKHFASLAESEGSREEAARIRDSARGRKVALGIDRLDYTKGIPRRLLAIERFLEREPTWRDKVLFLQLAVPTRERVTAYSDFRTSVNELVGRINGQYGAVDFTPLRYLYRSVPEHQVSGMYVAADVMLVTPLRDGMNLVAKEYVASRAQEDGVLVLSEFAGAASELTEAVRVNPNDVERLAGDIKHALTMPLDEQRSRMRSLRARVFQNDVGAWRESFLAALDQATNTTTTKLTTLLPPSPLVEDLRGAARLGISLDYDGTLVPFAKVPSLAAPDDEVLRLLEHLSNRPGAHVQIVSGRKHEEIEAWFGRFEIELFAEHGLWWRKQPGAPWEMTGAIDTRWQATVLPIFEDTARRTSGSSIERKSNSIAWHFRTCEPEIATRRVGELKKKLAPLLPELGLQALDGARVLEIRAQGVGKMIAAKHLAKVLPAGTRLVAIGDDVTDEDLFGALPDDAVTIHVGGGMSIARYRLEDPYAVRGFLWKVLGGQ